MAALCAGAARVAHTLLKYQPMSERQPQNNPRAARVEPLCRAGASLEGSWPLVSLQRLSEDFAAAADGSAHWTLQGSTKAVAGAEPELWVQLNAHAVVPLQCQRCLGPMAQRLIVNRAIRFVRGEELAARLDEKSDDDVLSLPAALDVLALVEDELILSLPIVPRHEGPCPQPLLPEVGAGGGAPLAAASDEPHPFAPLAGLKRGRDGT